MPTEIRTARSSGFTEILPGAAGAAFSDLNLNSQLVANALTAPTDTPGVDTLRILRDAAGKRVEWHYSVTAAAWKGVELA